MAHSTYAELPHRFEAGTPTIAEASGWGRRSTITGHRHGGDRRARAPAHRVRPGGCSEIPGLRSSARRTAVDRGATISFALRASTPTTSPSCSTSGHRRPRRPSLRPAGCVRYGVPATTRASFSLYTTLAEIDALVDGPAASAVLREVRTTHELESMYQEIILDHYRHPHTRAARPVRRRGAPRQPDLRRRGHAAGPRRRRHGRGRSSDGEGCSISQASTSVMTDLVIGSRGEALRCSSVPRADARRVRVEPDEDVLEDAVAFAGVSRFPARVKCALLGWMALKARPPGPAPADEETR